MDKSQHNGYVQKIKELQDSISSIDDLELTEEEDLALAELDPKYFDLAAEILSKYRADNPKYDYMELMVNKALARFVMDVLPTVETGYRMGVESGNA